MTASRFTPDERTNMQLRYAAGESVQSIAEDYDTSRNTIYYHVSPLYRQGRIRRNSRRRKPTESSCPKSQ